MRDELNSIIKKINAEYVELRYHNRVGNTLVAQKGRVDTANSSSVCGVGVRVFEKGAWGFASTSHLDSASIAAAAEKTKQCAQVLARKKNSKGHHHLAAAELYRGEFIGPGFDALQAMSLSDKLAEVVRLERLLASQSKSIDKAKCRYREMFEEKVVVTSDGASAGLKLALPEITFSAIAASGAQQTSAFTGAGVSGDWSCLFAHPTVSDGLNRTAQLAVDLLKAKYPQGGSKTCILSPPVVGLLCHEAIGHTVEADFVKAGSVAKGKIGERVASPLVNMADSGCETIAGYAVGNMPFDDEGVPTQNTMIIEKGILKSYLHNRESAAEFSVKPTGNARAWLYDDEPLIRMRNTYFLPGERRVDDMIAEIDDGYLVDGAGSGQADSNGEFMFGVDHVWRIKNGKKTELLREVTLSGIAFDVLKTVDAVSREFRWDLGTGYCGKGQPAKVDAGGPLSDAKFT